MITKRQSVRFRLTIWYVCSLTFILLLFAFGVYGLVAWSFRRQAKEQLIHAFNEVADAYVEGGDELAEIEEHNVIPLFAVASGASAPYQSKEWTRNNLSPVLAGSGLDDVRLIETAGGDPLLLFSSPVPGTVPRVTVGVAISQRTTHESLQTLAWTLALSLPLAVGLAAIGGSRLAKRALAPVNAIIVKARQISADRLEERLPVVNADDEFGQLATVFNGVLDRLQESFERLKRFTSDASHEMRTPLTAMRSVGEVALHDHLQAVQYREVIGSMLEEGDRLTRLLESLLTLARADHAKKPFEQTATDVSERARDACELMRSLAEEKNQTLLMDAEQPLMVDVDPDLLRQTIVNLLDNAIKYTPSGGIIRVCTALAPSDEVTIEISDTGPGIALEHQSKIFDRFYRVDKARSRETGGVGLGLALVKSAVELSGGRIELVSESGHGSTFRIVLPGLLVLQRVSDAPTSLAASLKGERS